MFLLKWLILLAKPCERYFPSAATPYRAEKWMLEGAKQMLTNASKLIWLVEIVTKENQPPWVEINPNLITMEEVELLSKGELKAGTYNFLFFDSRKA